MIAAGRFRTAAVVERVRSDATPGDDGKIDLSNDANWETYIERRVELLSVTMRESVYAQRPVAAGTMRITTWRDCETDAITPKMRVRADGRLFQIDGIIRVGNPARLIELTCVEVS